jgi:hypothetical protein
MFLGVWRPYELIFCMLSIEKKRLGLSLLRDALSWRMVLITQNLPSPRLKKRFCWCPWSDVLRAPKAIRTNFLHSGFLENGRRSSSYVSSRQMAMRTNNLLSVRLNMRLWWSRWSIVWKWRMTMKSHFLHPGHPKSEMDDVVEVM